MTTNGLDALALVEIESIARGYLVMDLLAKRARVTVRWAHPVTPGKFIILFAGEIASIEEAMDAAQESAGTSMMSSMLLPQVHPALLDALAGQFAQSQPGAVAIIEMDRVAKTLEAADMALKAAEVGLLKMHLAKGIGGKGFFILAGDLADVEAAVASLEHSFLQEFLLARELIPNPQPDVRGFFSS
jgi:microcompartment protein CcmL/EutN